MSTVERQPRSKTPMTPDQIKRAGHRLQLGITNVGFWVVAASAGLLGAYTGSLAFGLAEPTPLDALLGHAC